MIIFIIEMANYQELIEYLDKKFAQTAAKQEVNARFDVVEKRLDVLTNAVDNYMRLGESYFQEMVVLSRKVERIEGWVRKIADKIGIKLDE